MKVNVLMSVGSILDVGGDPRKGLANLQKRLSQRQVVQLTNDAASLRSDWVAIGQDLKRPLDRAGDVEMVTGIKK